MQIPSTTWPDSTLALAQEGYRFIPNRCDRLGSDIFQTRLLLEKTICLRGEAAARLFYDTRKFKRAGAAPKRVQQTLTGETGVQGLDGEAHRQRKQAFMTLMTPERLDKIAQLTALQWQAYAERWQQQQQVILFDAVEELLCRAVCAWSGVPLPEAEVAQRTHDLSTMIAGAGKIGPPHWRAKQARQRAERWIEGVLRQVRDGSLKVPGSTAVHTFAQYCQPSGELLDLNAAAVDLLNVLRPTVAIGRFIVFGALALHQHPEQRQKIQSGGSDYAAYFTQEVRRYYPFFPFAAAYTTQAFDWQTDAQTYSFPDQTKVLLDLYGTNHDPVLWQQPDTFEPERFQQWTSSGFDLIPQGGGDYYTNHRCAGEWLTIRLMDQALQFLASAISYRVPPQDLSFQLSTIPTLPKSRFVISEVRFS